MTSWCDNWLSTGTTLPLLLTDFLTLHNETKCLYHISKIGLPRHLNMSEDFTTCNNEKCFTEKKVHFFMHVHAHTHLNKVLITELSTTHQEGV